MATEAAILTTIEDTLIAGWPDSSIELKLSNTEFTPPASGKWADIHAAFTDTEPVDLAGSRRRYGGAIIRLYWTRKDGGRNILTKARAIADLLDGKGIGSTTFENAVIRDTLSEHSKRIEIPFFDTESGG